MRKKILVVKLIKASVRVSDVASWGIKSVAQLTCGCREHNKKDSHSESTPARVKLDDRAWSA